MTRHDFDVLVIGSGPGGEGAAMKAAKSGKKVAVVERFKQVGGGCTHWGTIPSKALRHAIQMIGQFRANPLFAHCFENNTNHRYGLGQLLATAESVVRRQVSMREGFYDRNRVPLIEGDARFVDEHTIAVTARDGAITACSADFFVIATGSRPYHPPDIDFDHPRVLDADKVLALTDTPVSMTIYGAGVIGCEYASMFRAMGIKLNLINTRAKLLEFLDDEIIDALAYHMRDTGIVLRHNEECDRVEPLDDGVLLHLKSGKIIKSDYLLWANGRTANSDSLGLESLKIETDHRGRITVNQRFQTNLPHISAVGDVIGPPSLASASYDQGRFAAAQLCGTAADTHLAEEMPSGIYTSPEISCIGANERELTEAKVPYEIGHAFFKSLARPDHEHRRGHVEDSVPPGNAGDSGHSLLRPRRRRDHPHRPGHHAPAPTQQHADVFREHHIQLPHDGRGLPGRGAERPEP
ncbi:MAG: Si-specific NAD(P)(+) transhydrogenase, partial [Phycisphaeraceae bacterium]